MPEKQPLTPQQAEEVTRQAFLAQDKMEQAAAVGISGPPQIRSYERNQFLGQFPERVLHAVSTALLGKAPPLAEVKEALYDSRGRHFFVNARYIALARPALLAAKERQIPLTVVHSPEFNNDIVLVVTAGR